MEGGVKEEQSVVVVSLPHVICDEFMQFSTLLFRVAFIVSCWGLFRVKPCRVTHVVLNDVVVVMSWPLPGHRQAIAKQLPKDCQAIANCQASAKALPVNCQAPGNMTTEFPDGDNHHGSIRA